MTDAVGIFRSSEGYRAYQAAHDVVTVWGPANRPLYPYATFAMPPMILSSVIGYSRTRTPVAL
jgi:hypothetical protein